MKTAHVVKKLFLVLLIIPLVLAGVFYHLVQTDSPIFPPASAAGFSMDFTKNASFTVSSSSDIFSPHSIKTETGVVAIGEIGNETYAVVVGDQNGVVSEFAAIIKYDKTTNKWNWVKSVYLFLDHEESKVIFWENHIILTGRTICDGANPGSYNYNQFVQERKLGGDHSAMVCNIALTNGNLSVVENIPLTDRSGGGTYSTDLRVIDGQLYMAVDGNKTQMPSYLFKFIGFSNNQLVVRAIRKCEPNRCLLPNHPNENYIYGTSTWKLDTGNNTRVIYSYILTTSDSYLRILSRDPGNTDGEFRIYKVDKNTGQPVGYVKLGTSHTNRYTGKLTNVDALYDGNKHYLLTTHFTNTHIIISVYRDSDLMEFTTPWTEVISRTAVNDLRTGPLFRYGNTLTFGLFKHLPNDKAGAQIFQNADINSGNVWNAVSPHPIDNLNERAHLQSFFFSGSNNKIFAGNLWKSGTTSPGIWVIQLDSPNTPTLCTTMLWSQTGNRNISLGQGESGTLVLTGLPENLNGVARFVVYDRANTSNNKTITATTVNGRATTIISHDWLKQNFSSKSFQINGILPGGNNDPMCVNYAAIYEKPVVEETTIACVNIRDPFSLRVTVNSMSLENLVTKNTVYLMPLGTGPSNLTVNAQGQVTSSMGSNPIMTIHSDMSAGASLNYGATYTDVTRNLSRQKASWSFTIKFDKNASQPNYSMFYNPSRGNRSGGFDMYTLIHDQTSSNAINSSISKITVMSKNDDPFENCAQLYYKTNGGDYRSNERPVYSSNGYVTSTQQTNKIWRVKKQDTQYNDAVNANTNAQEALSTYSAELVGAPTNCTNLMTQMQSSNSNFCFAPNANGLTLSETLTSLGSQINEATNTNKTLNRVDVEKGTILSNTKTGLAYSLLEQNNAISKNGLSVTIRLENIPVDYSPLVIYISKFNQVNIIDNKDRATPQDVIVWCVTESCTMNLANTASFASSTISSNTNTLNYPMTQTASYANTKGRMYLNFPVNVKSESVPVPAQVGKVNLTTLAGQTVSVSNPRRIILDGASTGASYYLGAMLTSGYIYSDRSVGTNIIKGLVVARGIAVRENTTARDNIDPERKKFLYFRDYPNPFMYIDFDAKYMFNYRGIFSLDASEVQREYIGL